MTSCQPLTFMNQDHVSIDYRPVLTKNSLETSNFRETYQDSELLKTYLRDGQWTRIKKYDKLYPLSYLEIDTSSFILIF